MANTQPKSRALEDFASEKEFDLLKAESIRHFWVVVPQLCLFAFFSIISLASSDLASFRSIACWNTFMIACNCSFQLWVSRASTTAEFKERNSHRASTQAVLGFLSYCVYFAFEDQNNKYIMEGGRTIMLPLASAWECRDEGELLFFAVALVMPAVERVVCCFTGSTDGAVQKCVISICALGMIFQLMQGRAIVRSDKETLTSLCRTVRRILGSMCDGYCVVNCEGLIVGADMKLLCMVGAGTNVNALDGRPLKSLMDQEFSVTGEGLKYARLRTGDEGQVIDSEVYSVAGEFTSESLRDILGHWCTDVDGKVKGHLCAVRETNQGEASTSRQPQSGSEAMDAIGEDVFCVPATLAEDDEEEEEGDFEQLAAPSEWDKLSQAPSVQKAGGSKGFFPSMKLLGIGVGDYTRVELIYNRKPSVVWQVKGSSGQLFAMKELHLPGILWRRDFLGNLVRADRELRSMKRFQWASSVIVEVVEGWLREDMVLCIVMEWIPVTLKSVLERRRGEGQGPPETEDVGRWLSHVVAGLAVIHSEGYMHRDLKESNLLLTPDLQRCKIADFGLAREVRQPDGGVGAEVNSTIAGDDDGGSVLSGYTVGCGTKGYMSPEIRAGGKYDQATDVFSLGCVLFDLLTLGGVEACQTAAMASEVFASQGPSDGDVRELRALCTEMLDDSSVLRPTAMGLTQEHVLQPHLQSLLQSHPELERAIALEAPEGLGLLQIDAQGLIVSWSSSLASFFGASAEDVLGHSLQEQFVPHEHRSELDSLVGPVARGQDASDGMVTFKLPAGRQRVRVAAKACGNRDVSRIQGPAGVQLKLVSCEQQEMPERHASSGLRERKALRHQ